MRLLICGDRNYGDADRILRHLRAHKDSVEVVIHGAARGADTFAEKAAQQLGIPTLSFPAQWDVYGKRAGPLRNTQMLNDGKPTHVWAFHDNIAESKGTKNMIAQATKAGLPVALISKDDDPLDAIDEAGRKVISQVDRNLMGFKVLRMIREDIQDREILDYYYVEDGDALVLAITHGDDAITLYDCVIKHRKEYSVDELAKKP